MDLGFGGSTAVVTGLRTAAPGQPGRPRRRQRSGWLHTGVGADAGVASTVAAEIAGAGGSAIADESDVAAPSGAQALIDAAVDKFGRLDILINNAGIIRWAGFPEADPENLARHLAVHVLGSFNTTRAAWPHMVEQGYGRIVMTTSSGMFGLPKNLSYATAKGGVIGLTRSLATHERGPRHQGQSHRAGGHDPHGRAGRRSRTTPRRPCRRTWWRRWWPSWPTRPARSTARSTPPARAVRPHLHRLDPGYVAAPEPTDRGRGRALGRRSTTSRATSSRRPPDWSAAFMAHLQAEQ